MQNKIMIPLEVQYGTYQQEIIMVLDDKFSSSGDDNCLIVKYAEGHLVLYITLKLWVLNAETE